EQQVAKVRETSYAETMYHRRRYLPDITSGNATVRSFAERNAVNAPIQGTAADIMKLAMIRVYNRMKAEGLQSKLILQVHDELNFTVLPSEKQQLERIVLEEMQNVSKLRVPLIADAGWGKNWLEAH
ncbi:MAG: DNA polymerase I, partial [Prevotella sp.]|nr:DNA polymerase I [Prevotella sp.]